MNPALALAVGVATGLVVVSALTPIVGRGDFGQWLMASRFYLGQSVPDYRDVSALPGLVPAVLAVIRLVIPDPVLATSLLTSAILAGLAGAFFAVGRIVLGSTLGGTLSLATNMLITDRVLELFAFGGLLQLAALALVCLGVAAFVRAGRSSRHQRRWWLLGTGAIALTIATHVGTALIALPVGMAVASLAALGPQRPIGQRLRSAAEPLLLLLGIAGLYVVAVLLPGNTEYLANPASLAYRGPERLFNGLLSYWPNTAVLAIGATSMLVGLFAEVRRGRVGPYVLLAAWALATWTVLGYSILTGVATDYPRFSTVLLAPLAVAAAGGLLWLFRVAATRLRGWPAGARRRTWLLALSAALILVITPFSVGRFARLTTFYQPRDAATLSAMVTWIDQRLGTRDGTILTSVREGKWIEGMTGRPTLFKQPVRYAFRPGEWQRGLDADTLLRSTLALTNEYFFVKFTGSAPTSSGPVPRGWLAAVNHGGEYVELVDLSPANMRVAAGGDVFDQAHMSPISVDQVITPDTAEVTTRWETAAAGGRVTMAQTVELIRYGSTMRVITETSADHLALDIRPTSGISIASANIVGGEATVCFTRIGSQAPCLRIWAAEPDAIVTLEEPQTLRIATTESQRLEFHVTVLSQASPWTSLAALDPRDLVEQYNVVAAVLLSTDPGFETRQSRLRALGFTSSANFGDYAVLVRE